MSKKITIEPVTRVEGHGKVTIQLNDNHEVVDSRLHIVEFRGFERFVQGRPYWEAPVLVQRLCGICRVYFPGMNIKDEWLLILPVDFF